MWDIHTKYKTSMFNPVDRKQGSHFSALTKFQDFSRILYKIPGIIFFFFNVASTYNWVSVYTLYVLLLHCFVYTTQKYAYLPLQPPIMTCITLNGGS